MYGGVLKSTHLYQQMNSSSLREVEEKIPISSSPFGALVYVFATTCVPQNQERLTPFGQLCFVSNCVSKSRLRKSF